MFEGFVHPALAAGAALAAVPLLIHLLNRQRHQPLEWAAMRFVVAAYKKTRRRSQLENLILLLLRMGAVALLALAVARPYLGKDSVLAPLTESRRDLVILIDGSASTGYRENVETVFERAVARARDLCDDLDGTRGDRVRLILAASAPRLLSARAPADALAVLGTLTAPTDEPLDLAAALAEVATWAGEEAAGGAAQSIEVRLLTDLQRGSFVPDLAADAPDAPDGAAEPEGPPALFAALDKLDELGVRVLVEDLGPASLDPPNLAVAAVDTFGPIVGPGGTVEIGVRIASHGAGGAASARVALEVDGERRPSRTVDLAAGGSAEVVFPVVFPDAGLHVVTARLEGDALAVDDARDQVVLVPPPLEVLLVDGAPSDDVEKDEVGYLRTVLQPPDETSMPGAVGLGEDAPFRTTVTTDLGLEGGEVDLARFDVIVLANVPVPTPRTLAAIEARVAAGAALWITAGDRLEAARDDWNARAFRPDGTGLLPARIGRLVEVADRRADYYRAGEFQQDHPALAFFADERWRPFLTEVPFFGFVSSEPREDALVLIRLDDDQSRPLLLERAFDRGRVLLWTSTIDAAWTKLPESPRTLVPLVHELLRYAGRGPEASRNVAVGDALVAETDAFPRDLAVARPDGSRRPLDGEPAEVAKGVWRLPAVLDTDRAGVYSIERGDAPPIPFAVQLEPRESDLARLAPEELQGLHRALVAVDQAQSGDDGAAGDDAPARGELWRWVALVCLATLIAESLFAAWIGRKRRIA